MITQLTPDMHGKRISCKINSSEIEEALIVYQERDHYYYILNNSESGSKPDDGEFEGYKFSWCIGNGSLDDMDSNKICDIKFLEILSPEIY